MPKQGNVNYTNEFKTHIAQLVLSGKSTGHVAKEYALTKSMVYIWAATYKRANGFFEKGDNEPELLKLRNENERLKTENNVLKQVFSIMATK